MKDPKLKDLMFQIIHYILQTLAKGFKMDEYLILLNILRTLMKDPKLKDFMFLIIHCILQTLAKGFKMEGYYILQTTSRGLT